MEVSQVVLTSQGQCKFGYVESGSEGLSDWIDASLFNFFCLPRSLITFSQPKVAISLTINEQSKIKENIDGKEFLPSK